MPKDVLLAARRVKELVRTFDPEARVYVFGSAARGELTAASDIDVLVLTERVDLKYEILVKVYRYVEEPVELHVVNEKQLKGWYRRFIPPGELVEV
ncbi:MAG: nucleotidyltransferase domain-containing protein [Thermofilaceae archaeon]